MYPGRQYRAKPGGILHMGRKVVVILICALLYVLFRMFFSGVTIDSDVYGYYKDGKLNRRGIISLVQQVKRLIPIKTTDTTVVGVTYNYTDGNPPKGQINYYHRIDEDKVDFYVKHRQEVVNHMASVQCSNPEVAEMLKQLDKITISFYQKDQFLFGMEVSDELCSSGSGAKDSDEPKGSVDPDVPESDDPSSVQDVDPVCGGDGRGGQNGPAAADPVVTNHISLLSKNLPIKTSFGQLAAVEADGEKCVRHIFDVDGSAAGSIDLKRDLIIKSYCTNAHLKELLDRTARVNLVFRKDGNEFLTWTLNAGSCR